VHGEGLEVLLSKTGCLWFGFLCVRWFLRRFSQLLPSPRRMADFGMGVTPDNGQQQKSAFGY
jgi:hypothetical protein